MGSQGRSPRQGLGAVAPHSAPARMPGVYAQSSARCRAYKAYTAFHRGRGLGIRQGCRDRTPKGFARTQSQQSVLKGIENLLYFYKYRLFLQTESDRVLLSDLFLYAFKIPFGSILEGCTFFILCVAVKAKLSGIIGDRVIFKCGKFS